MDVKHSIKKHDWRQIKRWNEIVSLLEAASEHKLALERETERTCELLFAYGYQVGAGETAKADDLKLMRWAKQVPVAYPRALSIVLRLNNILEAAVEHDCRTAKPGETN